MLNKIAIFSFIIVLLVYLDPDWQNLWPQAGWYDDQGEPAVALMYGKHCDKYCRKAQAFLDMRQVPYDLIDLQASQDVSADFGHPNTVPLLAVGKLRTTGFNAGAFSSLLAQQYGERYLTAGERRIYRSHFDQEGKPKVIMYGADWCGVCESVRQELNLNNIRHEFIDVEKPVKQGWLLQTLGIYGYPIVYIGYKRLKVGSYQAIIREL